MHSKRVKIVHQRVRKIPLLQKKKNILPLLKNLSSNSYMTQVYLSITLLISSPYIKHIKNAPSHEPQTSLVPQTQSHVVAAHLISKFHFPQRTKNTRTPKYTEFHCMPLRTKKKKDRHTPISATSRRAAGAHVRGAL